MWLIIIQCVLLASANGLEFEPKPVDPESTLIQYKSGVEATSLHFRNRLDSFLAPYRQPPLTEAVYHIVNCKLGEAPAQNQYCEVNINHWHPCISSRGYNYKTDRNGPCVFLTIRKDSNWIPEYYNSSTIPENMPQDLKEHIQATEQREGPDSNELKVLWVSCSGSYPVDSEHIGPIRYYPRNGFGGQYFPIKNEKYYLNPLIAVYLESPARQILINIQCKAWARNLNDEVVHFELLADYY